MFSGPRYMLHDCTILLCYSVHKAVLLTILCTTHRYSFLCKMSCRHRQFLTSHSILCLLYAALLINHIPLCYMLLPISVFWSWSFHTSVPITIHNAPYAVQLWIFIFTQLLFYSHKNCFLLTTRYIIVKHVEQNNCRLHKINRFWIDPLCLYLWLYTINLSVILLQ